MRDERHRTSDRAPSPVSWATVQADNAFVEAVRAEEPSLVEDHLTRLLVSWKRDIDAAPFPSQPDLAAAETALTAGTGPPTRRWVLTPVAAAAAAVGIALSGVALVAHDARPGDPLWGVTKVVYSDHAQSVAAAYQAQAELQLAERALAAGSPDAARTALNRVSDALLSVRDEARRAELTALYSSLTAQLVPPSPPRPPPPPVPTGAPTTNPAAPSATIPLVPRPPLPAAPSAPGPAPASTTQGRTPAVPTTPPPPLPLPLPPPPPMVTTTLAPSTTPVPTSPPSTTPSSPNTAPSATSGARPAAPKPR